MSQVSPFDQQTQRIKHKLKQARECDPGFAVFGASAHGYKIGPPLSARAIAAFERKNGISLPLDFVAFLTEVGHGAPANGAAAGPFYGIYPLGKNVAVSGDAKSLRELPVVQPDMSEAEWNEHSRVMIAEDEKLLDKEYAAASDRLYAGLLMIGHQGCMIHHALLVAGPNKGRVINIDMEGSKPRFAFEANFLDWYERWLDEIISGALLRKPAVNFGYFMSGDDRQLFEVYDAATARETKFEALRGLIKLTSIEPGSCKRLDEICGDGDRKIAGAALEALAKFDFALARPHLERLIQTDDAGRLRACETVSYFATASRCVIAPLVLEHLGDIQETEAFRAALNVLGGTDCGDAVVPFAAHADQDMRQTAFRFLGKAPDKARYINVFLDGLQDEATVVVHAALQALTGLTDERLLPAFKALAERYPTEEGYIRVNLEHALKPFGYSSLGAFERSAKATL